MYDGLAKHMCALSFICVDMLESQQQHVRVRVSQEEETEKALASSVRVVQHRPVVLKAVQVDQGCCHA